MGTPTFRPKNIYLVNVRGWQKDKAYKTATTKANLVSYDARAEIDMSPSEVIRSCTPRPLMCTSVSHLYIIMRYN